MNFQNKKIIIISDRKEFDNIEQVFAPNEEIVFFDKEKIRELKNIKEKEEFILVFNKDDDKIFDTVKESEFEKVSYGFSENSDFMASDVNETEEGINFKINYRGNTIPIWLKNKSSNSKIYEALAIICIASILGKNILEIAEKIK